MTLILRTLFVFAVHSDMRRHLMYHTYFIVLYYTILYNPSVVIGLEFFVVYHILLCIL